MALRLFGRPGSYVCFVDDREPKIEHYMKNSMCVGFVPTTEEARTRLETYGMRPVIRSEELVVYR